MIYIIKNLFVNIFIKKSQSREPFLPRLTHDWPGCRGHGNGDDDWNAAGRGANLRFRGVSGFVGGFYHLYLEPQTTIYKWMFGETTIFYIKTWNHPIKTTIYKWLFGVPGMVYVFIGIFMVSFYGFLFEVPICSRIFVGFLWYPPEV